jgi:hypothetical protein
VQPRTASQNSGQLLRLAEWQQQKYSGHRRTLLDAIAGLRTGADAKAQTPSTTPRSTAPVAAASTPETAETPTGRCAGLSRRGPVARAVTHRLARDEDGGSRRTSPSCRTCASLRYSDVGSKGTSIDVGAWLRDLGRGEYDATFRENAISEKVLPNLTAEDLKDMGIGTVGHRRMLLDAIAGLRTGADAKAQTPSTTPLSTVPVAVASTPASARYADVLRSGGFDQRA